jgi:hypothetical protein
VRQRVLTERPCYKTSGAYGCQIWILNYKQGAGDIGDNILLFASGSIDFMSLMQNCGILQLCGFYHPVLQLSLVSIILPLIHTHSFIYSSTCGHIYSGTCGHIDSGTCGHVQKIYETGCEILLLNRVVPVLFAGANRRRHAVTVACREQLRCRL